MVVLLSSSLLRLNTRASFQVGLCVLRATEVFFFLSRRPALMSETLTRGPEAGRGKCIQLVGVKRTASILHSYTVRLSISIPVTGVQRTLDIECTSVPASFEPQAPAHTTEPLAHNYTVALKPLAECFWHCAQQRTMQSTSASKLLWLKGKINLCCMHAMGLDFSAMHVLCASRFPIS